MEDRGNTMFETHVNKKEVEDKFTDVGVCGPE